MTIITYLDILVIVNNRIFHVYIKLCFICICETIYNNHFVMSELERQERRDLETRALSLIKDAKRKWENAEKEKVAQLNKHIEIQTVRITELCTSNNEMSSRLQRTECELQTTNAELHKLRVFQVNKIYVHIYSDT